MTADVIARALEIIQSGRRLDLLMTDVGLPGGMSGRQLADAALIARPGMKILFITGYAENAIMGDGPRGAGLHILTKPFSLKVLGQRIKEIFADISRPWRQCRSWNRSSCR